MGYGIFVIVLGGVLGAAAIVRRVWPEADGLRSELLGSEWSKAGTDDTEVLPSRTSDKSPSKSWILVGVILVLVGLEMGMLAQISSSRERGAAGIRLSADGTDPVDLPAFLGTEWIGSRTEVSGVERDILPPDTGFSRRTYISVQDRSHAVFMSIVLSGYDRTSIHRPEVCLVGQGWTIESAAAREFNREATGKSLPVTMLRTSLIDPASQRKIEALTAYWFVSADKLVASHWQRFLWDAWNRVRHGRVDRWAYVLVQADVRNDEAAALDRIQTVLDATLPVFLLAGVEKPD
jgi:EpsI family protein